MLPAMIAAAIFAPGASEAYAQSCAALQRQLALAGSGGAADAALKRQLAALGGLERQRGCAKDRTSFICRDIAGRKAAVQKQMGGSSRGFNTSGIRARMAALGCGGVQEAKPRSRDYARRDSGTWIRNGAMLYCVRTSDGYFFPAPNSQFAEGNDEKLALDQCRFICQTAEVEVYTLPDISMETEEMVPVRGGKPYKDLPAAFRYRDDANFKSCDLQRYYQRVDELRARTVTPKDMANAIIPLPTPRPDLASSSSTDPATTSALGFAEEDRVDRKVRIVGPQFYPDKEELVGVVEPSAGN